MSDSYSCNSNIYTSQGYELTQQTKLNYYDWVLITYINHANLKTKQSKDNKNYAKQQKGFKTKNRKITQLVLENSTKQ